MLKLALKNITSKPLRFVATIVAIAVVVAMSFCMLSFKGAVYDYIYATETAFSGVSDITISANSAISRVMDADDALSSLEGVRAIVPVLKLYALLGDEYVEVRGFEAGQSEILQSIEIVKGALTKNPDNIVISEEAAAHFGLDIEDEVVLTLGSNRVKCLVGAIAKKSGYFLSDAPFQIIGCSDGFSGLIASGVKGLCNEIHVLLEDGADIDKTIENICGMEKYGSMFVKASKDDAYVEEKTQSLTAPVVLAGVAVLLLGVAVIALLYAMSASEKRALVSKLSVVGATKRQILSVFLIESMAQACIGAVLGSALSIGVFVGLLKLTLSSSIAFSVSTLYLFLSGVIGFVAALLSSILPVIKAFKGTIRENMLDLSDNKKRFILPLVLMGFTAIFIIVGAFVDSVTGVMSLIGIVCALAALASISAPALKGVAAISTKSGNPSVKVASIGMVREKRFARSAVILTTGMTIAMMLFMAWSLTTTIFTSYISEFENMAFVSNVKPDVDVERFGQVEGVEGATSIVWAQAELELDNEQKTMNVLGSADVLDLVDFEYITAKSKVYELISTDKPCVFVDIALQKLYGVKEGDTLNMTLGDKTQKVVVGGILKHELFSGNYIVMSQSTIKVLFEKDIDTVLVVASADKDMDDVVGALRTKYAQNNYYVVSVLESFRWDMESMQSVFDLIGTLSIVVALFILGVSITSSLIGRGTAKKDRVALLNAGMSKNALLKAEIFEYALTAIVAFVLSMLSSLVITYGLINALRLFGLYFEFMYEAWVTLVAGGAMCVCYTLVPLAFGFKKGYNLKRV